jgi:hypothetical protein
MPVGAAWRNRRDALALVAAVASVALPRYRELLAFFSASAPCWRTC